MNLTIRTTGAIWIFLAFAMALPVYGISEADVAGIVYNETSGIRPNGQNASELTLARGMIAELAYKRDGHGMAAPAAPSADALQNPVVKAIWAECTSVASSAKAIDPGDCKHVIIWPSDDGKVPTSDPKLTANPPWPYTDSAKIKTVWGPFRVPAKVGDVPKGDNIYIFIYCGVQ